MNCCDEYGDCRQGRDCPVRKQSINTANDFWQGYVPEPVKPAQDVVTNLTPTYAFFQPPKPVGAWVLDPGGVVQTQFAMYSKPTDEQIKNTETMFGWKWKDLP